MTSLAVAMHGGEKPALAIQAGLGSALMLQDAEGATWPQALLDLELGLDIRLDESCILLAGLGVKGISDSPLASTLSYRPGFTAWGSSLGLRVVPFPESGFNAALILGLNTGRSALTDLYFFYPSVDVQAGWLLPPLLPHTPPPLVVLHAGVQFRQDPGISFTTGLKAYLHLASFPAPQSPQAPTAPQAGSVP